MKKNNHPTVIVDENHHIRSIRLNRFQSIISKAPLNWAVLIKFTLAGVLAGIILAWII
ncbi:MAG TPA: hypothetical protein PLP71_10415 [Syntrophomonadaceae bacterium]|nr:hypothetical protein [Syntrophomonadaceae bacterium]